MLRHVPFDYLKVDHGIISTAMEGGKGRPAMMAILAFARESNAMVLAEGVETEASLELVQDIDRGSPYEEDLIQLAQGFLLGMPAAGFGLALEGGQSAA
jgi:EAL domain-containing protein (putative c-di-GMP-specific phosphodiesterase class I)